MFQTTTDTEKVNAAAQAIQQYFAGEAGFTAREFSAWIVEFKYTAWYYHKGLDKLKRNGLVDKTGDRYFILKTPRCCPTCKRPFPPGKGVGIKLD